MVIITPQQLKQTNLIFLEHKKLSKEVDLLLSETKNLEIVNGNLERVDSLRTEQLKSCMDRAETYSQNISALNKSIEQKDKKTKKWRNCAIGGMTVSVGLLVAFILIK